MPAIEYRYAVVAGRRSPLISLGIGLSGRWQRVAALLGLSFGLLIEVLDDTLKVSTDFMHHFNMEPLAQIGKIDGYDDGVLITSLAPRSPISESYRMLRTNLRFVSVDKDFKVLVVTSPEPSEGKSTTAANLSVVLAESGKKVVLIDADLRRPTIHKIFDLSAGLGLTTALLENKSAAMKHLFSTPINGLQIMPSGPLPPNPSELVGSQRMQDLVEELLQHVDFVIVDSPPVLSVADSSLLAGAASGVLLVVRSGKSRLESTKRALKQLQSVQANILGMVLNNIKRGEQAYYQYDYYQQPPDDEEGRRFKWLPSFGRRSPKPSEAFNRVNGKTPVVAEDSHA